MTVLLSLKILTVKCRFKKDIIFNFQFFLNSKIKHETSLGENVFCPELASKEKSCSYHSNFGEKFYLTLVIIVAIVIPLLGTILAYLGLLAKVKKVKRFTCLHFSVFIQKWRKV